MSARPPRSGYRRVGDAYVFDNPAYTGEGVAGNSVSRTLGSQMRLKDFLSSIPSFSDFSDNQLITLERKATIAKFSENEIVFRQGEEGETFYVIHSGYVDILIQEDPSLLRRGDFGKVVNRLAEGTFFGERALMTAEPRAATVRAFQDTVCIAFNRDTFEEVISGNNALIGSDVTDNVDWSKDHETRSLYKHIEKIKQISDMDMSPKIRRIMYELTTAFTPELSVDEVIARMVITVKGGVRGDRVGLFVLSEDRTNMVLKVSERSKGIRLPVRGIAGSVMTSSEPVNIADAYQDNRFDSTLDRRTGYRTRQVICVPLLHPICGETIGVLQVNNRADGSLDKFSDEQQTILKMAAEQLAELLHGRAELFMRTAASRSAPQASIVGAVPGFTDNTLKRSLSTTILSSADIDSQFEVELFNVSFFYNDGIKPGQFQYFLVEVSLYLALVQLAATQSVTVSIPVDRSFYEDTSVNTSEVILDVSARLKFDILVRDLPRATRVMFKVKASKKKNAPYVTMGWAAAAVFDFKGSLACEVNVHLFPEDNDVPINTTLSNLNDSKSMGLSAVLAADFALSDDPEGIGDVDLGRSTPIEARGGRESFRALRRGMSVTSLVSKVLIVHTMATRSSPIQANHHVFTEEELSEINRILLLSFNPMSTSLISQADKDFLWGIRYSILDRPDLLPAFVMCVSWRDSDQVQEVYELLDLWDPPNGTQALQLLDRRFMDPKIRAFAVHCLEDLDDEELALYMLQLCQQLKFENHTDSALARFLLRRALANTRLIGHILFWQLQSEVYNVDVRFRYVVLLQIYIQHCGNHRVELGHQMFVMKKLENVAEKVKEGETKADRLVLLRQLLTDINLPSQFQLPLNPHIKVKGIIVDQCRVMESKKKPLWMTLKNSDPNGQNIVLMLKVGDDLRQDALILQLLRVMDDLWRREGLEMQMMLYDCISTGYERGLLQVVLNATTLGHVLLDATKKQNIGAGAFKRKIGSAIKALTDYDVLREWIHEQVCESVPHSNDAGREAEMERRTNNFIISTAAYCVASYVLGLGDRHNDNLMITKAGHFFHIDFGHILGNFKYKLGVKRERAPFVFTPAMKAVMRDAQYAAFQDLCCDIYNILREHAMLLVSLCSLAIPCNLPELREEKHVLWIYDKLLVGATDEEASAHFREQLDISLHTKGTQINDAAHMLVHA